MNWVIYGLRLKGATEVRYVGRTKKIEQRLAGHFSTAKQMPWATNFANWLLENKELIELVVLGTAEGQRDACRAERAAVAFCLALNHRLFNQWLVPADRRCAPRDNDDPPQLWSRAANDHGATPMGAA